ncbi:MAG TPA: DUF6250 domain-containing protein [Actinoplanes sp.]
MKRLLTAAVAAALTAGVPATAAAAPARATPKPAEAPRRIVERLDRGLVAVPSAAGTFLSWRLLGTEYGQDIAFNVYKGDKRLNRRPVTASTTFTDSTHGTGAYTVRPVIDGRERRETGEALTLPGGYAQIPLAAIPGTAPADYYVQHSWPGDLDGDGAYELVVSRLPYALDKPSYLEAYTLAGRHLWRVDLGPGSFTRAGGVAANDPAPAAISGFGEVAGFRNDDGVTVYDLDSDGRAEVTVKTAAGVVFGDGAPLTAALPTSQFVSVLDGWTGAEWTRVPVPDDFVADGTAGGQFGVGYLDGVHPSLITKLVTRIGAVRGDFRVAVAAWDFDGRTLSRRWKWVRDRGISFHQIRIVDVDGDGRDDIADGNYVVNSDGTFRYDVAGSTHGDRFHIGDLDPARPGLEGYAIQQTEGGVWTSFPWYYYDAATGERLVTGAHPDVPQDAALWDIPRGTVADIDPRHPGTELWAATANQQLPGAGVWSVRGKRISTAVPSVNFRIWWDGDTLAELLDSTHIDKWDYRTEASKRIFDPAGVTASWRNATPFYGDVLGDWREEVLAETADHTALRLFTTTAPTATRFYTLAHNPAYRLGWTVRGYLQSTLPDFFLGAGGRPPALPRIETTAGPERAWQPIVRDNFRGGTDKWTAELQSGGTVEARDGVLDIDVPGGASVWLRQELSGPYDIEYTATPVSAGGPNDHVTDLNSFFNARDVRSPDDVFATSRSGLLAEYDLLKTYYVGQGANLNTTTRFRRYVGEAGNRPLVFDLTEPRIEANTPVRVRWSIDGNRIRYYSDDTLVFDFTDPEPYRDGWFAFRTVASHFQIRDFTVWRPPAK